MIELGGTKLDIFGLYNDAMTHNPKNKPFGVFIDINLPHYRPNHQWFWKDAIRKKLKEKGNSFFGKPAPCFIAITNSAWHYEKSKRAGKGEGIICGTKSSFVDFPIKNPITFKAIQKAVQSFGKLPEDSISQF